MEINEGTAKDSFALRLYGSKSQELVTIGRDGTVTIHEEGAETEAARVFYEALEFEGKALHKRIETLEEAIRETERWLRGTGHAKMAKRLRRALEGK